jgi:hypothetical protein
MNTVSYGFRDTLNNRIIQQGYSSGNNNVNAEANNKVLKIDYLAWVASLPNPEDPNDLVNDTMDLLYGVPVSQETKDQIKMSILLKGQSSDYYWTQAWNAYITNPNDATAKKTVNDILVNYFKTIFGAAEYHLH